MSEIWRPFPLWVLKDEAGDFLLPTTIDLEAAQEAINRMKTDMSFVKSVQQKKSQQESIEYAEHRYNMLLEKAEELKNHPNTVKMNFELCEPDYATYQELKEHATDWIVGEPRLNSDRLGTKVLPCRIRLDGKVLDENGIKELSPMIGEALWRRMQTIIYPNPERLPFLQSLFPS